MRSQTPAGLTTSPFHGLDLGYASNVWDEASPVTALVLPFINTEIGFAGLREIVNAGYDEAIQSMSATQRTITALMADTAQIQDISKNIQNNADLLIEFLGFCNPHTDAPAVAAEYRNALAAIRSRFRLLEQANDAHEAIFTHLNAAMEFDKALTTLFDQFRILKNLVQSLDTINELGGDYKGDFGAVGKLTVAIKCLERVWASMREAYKEAKIVEEILSFSVDYDVDFSVFGEFNA